MPKNFQNKLPIYRSNFRDLQNRQQKAISKPQMLENEFSGTVNTESF